MPKDLLGFTGDATSQGTAGYRYEPLRKFRWELLIGGGQDAQNALKMVLLSCQRPTMQFDATEVHHFNDRHYLAGKPSFNTIEFTMNDARVGANATQGLEGGAPFASKLIEEWRDLVYNPRTNIALPAEGQGGYKKDCVLHQYDGQGNTMLSWSLLGCFPLTVAFDSLDYASSDAVIVTCTLRIDKAFII